MIEGLVNAAYEAVIALTLSGPTGQTRDIEAVVDTGYNGYLTLPPALAAELDLPLVSTGRAVLADGSQVDFNVHDVAVRWDGRIRQIEAHVADATSLVGMRLLDRHSLYVEVESGGPVVIQAMA